MLNETRKFIEMECLFSSNNSIINDCVTGWTSEMKEDTLTIAVNFTNPLALSQGDEEDNLFVKFWGLNKVEKIPITRQLKKSGASDAMNSAG
jgi:hypothetical protein